MSLRVRRAAPRGAVAFVVVALIATALTLIAPGGTGTADAAVHPEDTETRYREVWIDHNQFRGIHKLEEVEQPPPPEGEPPPEPVFECTYTGQRWFAEPTKQCVDYDPMDFDLPSLNGVTRAEVFLDLWRAREAGNADFRINGTRYVADDGDDWSRTPVLVDIELDDLQQGGNELTLLSASAYHLHDAAVRVYDANGPYPSGSGITSVSPAPVDGVLTMGADETITLSANVSGADAVEFIAYYDGFDRDNDGNRLDWQSFTRNNWHPGGRPKASEGLEPIDDYGTIGHIGTVHSNGAVVIGGHIRDDSRGDKSGSTYTIEFDTSFVPDGSPLRFKVRALNEASDGFWVVDALGGATAEVTVARDDFSVEYFIDDNFGDAVLHHASGDDPRTRPDARTRDITGVDLTDMVSAHLLHNFWDRPEVHINPSTPSNDDRCGNGPSERVPSNHWLTFVMDITDRVEEGTNVICYEHVSGFGVFLEHPGPMFVIRRDPDLAPTVDAGEPYQAGVGVPIFLVPVIDDDGDSDVEVSWSGAGATFADPTVERASVTFDAPGTYEVAIEVSDAENGPVSDTATVTVTEAPPPPTTLPPDPDDPEPPVPPVGEAEVGYWMGDAGGEIYGFGDADDPGVVTGQVVAVASTPTGAGLWVLTADGVVHALNDATHHGDVDLGTLDPGEQVASLSVLPDGSGYWVFTDRGRAIQFGVAADLEDLVDLGVSGSLQGLIVDSAATPSGQGAYMVAADGGVFAIGDATFEGSMGGIPLNGPVVGVATDPDGEGYWLVADDGGIFAFAAPFEGSMGGQPLNAPMVGAVAFGDGYLMVAADGGIFNFSNLEFLGSLGGNPPANPVSAVAGFPT
ncbi:MAG: PKD domain-containing protein [Actinomycetota bacterium]